MKNSHTNSDLNHMDGEIYKNISISILKDICIYIL